MESLMVFHPNQGPISIFNDIPCLYPSVNVLWCRKMLTPFIHQHHLLTGPLHTYWRRHWCSALDTYRIQYPERPQSIFNEINTKNRVLIQTINKHTITDQIKKETLQQLQTPCNNETRTRYTFTTWSKKSARVCQLLLPSRWRPVVRIKLHHRHAMEL